MCVLYEQDQIAKKAVHSRSIFDLFCVISVGKRYKSTNFYVKAAIGYTEKHFTLRTIIYFSFDFGKETRERAESAAVAPKVRKVNRYYKGLQSNFQ